MIRIIFGLVMLLPLHVSAAIISFDDDAASQDGIITYDGVGGPLVGAGIDFVSVVGTGTPLNDGTVLECRGCELAFTTGPNLSEGIVNTFAAGGSVSLTGSVFDGITLVATGVLAAGGFGSVSTSTVVGGTGVFTGLGFDRKHEDLVDFFGLGTNFDFASTDIALASVTGDGFTGFVAGVTNADFDNSARIPQPGTLALFGAGMLLLGRRLGLYRRQKG